LKPFCKTLISQNKKSTALHEAVKKGDLDAIKQALRQGVNVNAVDGLGRTALMEAALLGHLLICKHLMEQKADAHAVDKCSGSALHEASFCNRPEIAQLLLDAGVSLNAASSSGYTALMWAVRSHALDVVKLLLERKADTRPTCIRGICKGMNALDMAVGTAHDGIIALLHEHSKPPAPHAPRPSFMQLPTPDES